MQRRFLLMKFKGWMFCWVQELNNKYYCVKAAGYTVLKASEFNLEVP